MEIRPLTSNDLNSLAEIDATIESSKYLHLEQSGGGMSIQFKIEPRDLRQKSITPNPLGDDLAMIYRQVATGADEGIALSAEHDDVIVASAIAQPDPSAGTLRLIDVRVDYDFRRQGIGTAMVFAIIQHAREAELRAVSAESRTNNFPANQFLMKTGFELSGVDCRKYTNHDVVKESATLIWYASLE